MYPSSIFDESDELAEELIALVDVLIFNESSRIQISDVACSLSIEHWVSVRQLLRIGLLPSAAVVHRAQFEAITRSIWIFYAASEYQLSKLDSRLSLKSEQIAKNMPQAADMLEAISKNGPSQAYDALNRFKENSWMALNSYAHAGIHAIHRHGNGYPIELIHDVLRNANGLAVISFMQASVLSGRLSLQREILSIAAKHPRCMPPPL